MPSFSPDQAQNAFQLLSHMDDEARKKWSKRFEQLGIIPPQKDGAFTEFAQNVGGGMRRMASGAANTMVETGIPGGPAIAEKLNLATATRQEDQPFSGYNIRESFTDLPTFATTLGQGVGSSLGAMGAAVVGTAAGGPVGGVATTTATMFTAIYGDRLREYRDEFPDMEEEDVRGYALLSSGIESMLEGLFGPEALISRGFASKLVKKHVTKALKKGLLRGMATGVALGMAEGGITEAAEEMMQGMQDDIIKNIAGKDTKVLDWRKRLEEAIGGLIPGAFMGGPAALTPTMQEYRMIQWKNAEEKAKAGENPTEEVTELVMTEPDPKVKAVMQSADSEYIRDVVSRAIMGEELSPEEAPVADALGPIITRYKELVTAPMVADMEAEGQEEAAPGASPFEELLGQITEPPASSSRKDVQKALNLQEGQPLPDTLRSEEKRKRFFAEATSRQQVAADVRAGIPAVSPERKAGREILGRELQSGQQFDQLATDVANEIENLPQNAVFKHEVAPLLVDISEQLKQRQFGPATTALTELRQKAEQWRVENSKGRLRNKAFEKYLAMEPKALVGEAKRRGVTSGLSHKGRAKRLADMDVKGVKALAPKVAAEPAPAQPLGPDVQAPSITPVAPAPAQAPVAPAAPVQPELIEAPPVIPFKEPKAKPDRVETPQQRGRDLLRALGGIRVSNDKALRDPQTGIPRGFQQQKGKEGIGADEAIEHLQKEGALGPDAGLTELVWVLKGRARPITVESGLPGLLKSKDLEPGLKFIDDEGKTAVVVSQDADGGIVAASDVVRRYGADQVIADESTVGTADEDQMVEAETLAGKMLPAEAGASDFNYAPESAPAPKKKGMVGTVAQAKQKASGELFPADEIPFNLVGQTPKMTHAEVQAENKRKEVVRKTQAEIERRTVPLFKEEEKPAPKKRPAGTVPEVLTPERLAEVLEASSLRPEVKKAALDNQKNGRSKLTEKGVAYLEKEADARSAEIEKYDRANKPAPSESDFDDVEDIDVDEDVPFKPVGFAMEPTATPRGTPVRKYMKNRHGVGGSESIEGATVVPLSELSSAQQRMHQIAAKAGIDLRFFDVTDEFAKRHKGKEMAGFVSGDTIFLSSSLRPADMPSVLGHELVHLELGRIGPDAAEKVLQVVRDTLGPEKYGELMEEVHLQWGDEVKDDASGLAEILAEANAQRILDGEAVLENLAQIDRSLAQKVLDAVKKAIDAMSRQITHMFEGDTTPIVADLKRIAERLETVAFGKEGMLGDPAFMIAGNTSGSSEFIGKGILELESSTISMASKAKAESLEKRLTKAYDAENWELADQLDGELDDLYDQMDNQLEEAYADREEDTEERILAANARKDVYVPDSTFLDDPGGYDLDSDLAQAGAMILAARAGREDTRILWSAPDRIYNMLQEAMGSGYQMPGNLRPRNKISDAQLIDVAVSIFRNRMAWAKRAGIETGQYAENIVSSPDVAAEVAQNLRIDLASEKMRPVHKDDIHDHKERNMRGLSKAIRMMDKLASSGISYDFNTPVAFMAAKKRLRIGHTKLVEAALSAESAKDWYTEHQGRIEELFGPDAPLFAKLLAVTSAHNTVAGNMTAAIKAYNLIKSGSPIQGMGIHAKAVQAIADGVGISGQKVSSFAANLAGDPHAVTVDIHMARLLFGKDSPTPAQYMKATDTVRAVARELGWEARQVQAALWAHQLTKTGRTVPTYGNELAKKSQEIEDLISTFSDDAGTGEGVQGRGNFAEEGAGEAIGSVAFMATRPSQVASTTTKLYGATLAAPKAIKRATGRAKGLLDRTFAKVEKAYHLRKSFPGVEEELRRAADSREWSQELASKTVLEKIKESGVSEKDQRLLQYHREDKANYPVPKALQPLADWFDGMYAEIEKTYLSLDPSLGTWPASHIKQNESKIRALETEIEELAADDGDHDRAISNRRTEIGEIQATIEKLEGLRYARHLVRGRPDLMVQLDKWIAGDGLKSFPKEFVGRKIATMAELREALQGTPYVVEENAFIALADTLAHLNHRKKLHSFHESVKTNAELVGKTKYGIADMRAAAKSAGIELEGTTFVGMQASLEKQAPGAWAAWTDENPLAPDNFVTLPGYRQYEGYSVHPFLSEAIRDWTEVLPKGSDLGQTYDRLNSVAKQLKFYNFMVMSINNLQQGVAAAGFTTPLGIPDAMREVAARGPKYMRALEADVFSSPTDLPHTEFIDAISRAVASLNNSDAPFMKWLRKVTETDNPVEMAWKALLPTDKNTMLTMSRNMTWNLDRAFRLATLDKLMKDGMSFDEAVVVARNYHADYNIIRKNPGKWARRALLTPSYQYAMWKRLFIDELGSQPIKNALPIARIATMYLGASAIASMFGYAWVEGYRYVKKGKDEEGEDVERVALMMGPFAEPWKVIGRAMQGYTSGGIKSATARVMYPKTAAIPHALWSWIRNRDWKGSPITEPGAPDSYNNWQTAKWLIQELLPITGQVADWSDKDQTAVDNILRIFTLTRFRRKPMAQYFEGKVNRRLSELRSWAKKRAEEDPAGAEKYYQRAGEEFSKYMTSLNDSVKRHDAKIQAVGSPKVADRLVSQFDIFDFFGTYPDMDDTISKKQLGKRLWEALQGPPTRERRKMGQPVKADAAEKYSEELEYRRRLTAFNRMVIDDAGMSRKEIITMLRNEARVRGYTTRMRSTSGRGLTSLGERLRRIGQLEAQE